MKIDPLLIKAFRLSLIYGLGAFAYFYFSSEGQPLVDIATKAAATAGIFMLMYYVIARVLKQKGGNELK